MLVYTLAALQASDQVCTILFTYFYTMSLCLRVARDQRITFEVTNLAALALGPTDKRPLEC